jgi:hypothetical protein
VSATAIVETLTVRYSGYNVSPMRADTSVCPGDMHLRMTTRYGRFSVPYSPTFLNPPGAPVSGAVITPEAVGFASGGGPGFVIRSAFRRSGVGASGEESRRSGAGALSDAWAPPRAASERAAPRAASGISGMCGRVVAGHLSKVLWLYAPSTVSPPLKRRL